MAAAVLVAGCSSGTGTPVARPPKPPPTGTAVFLAVGPGPVFGGQLVAYDWSGRPVGYGLVVPGCMEACRIPAPSPDGHALIGVGTAPVVDLLGHRLGPMPPVQFWADDSRHLCGLQPGPPGTLTGDPYDPRVADYPVGGAGPDWQLSLGPLLVLPGVNMAITCSDTTGRAAVVETSNDSVSEVLVDDVATGRTLARRTYPSNPARLAMLGSPWVQVALSHDDAFIAEDVAGPTLAPTGPRADIRDMLSGRLLASLADTAVAAFSWDGTRVVAGAVPTGPVPTGWEPTVEVIDWRTGRVLWRHRGEITGVVAEPGGSGVAVALGGAVWVIPSTGKPRLVGADRTLLSSQPIVGIAAYRPAPSAPPTIPTKVVPLPRP
jgi:hypothetical protein